MASDGRLHPDRCLNFRREAARTPWPPSPCPHVVPAPDARVSHVRTHFSYVVLTTSRFYPGIAGPHLPAIGTSDSKAKEAIEAPAGDEFVSNFRSQLRERKTGEGRVTAATRATKVIGSLEHPILPMPPVRVQPYTAVFYALTDSRAE